MLKDTLPSREKWRPSLILDLLRWLNLQIPFSHQPQRERGKSLTGGAVWRIYGDLGFDCPLCCFPLCAHYGLRPPFLIFSLFCFFVRYHLRQLLVFEVIFLASLACHSASNFSRHARGRSYVGFGRCQVASSRRPITGYRGVQVWERCWVEPVLETVLTSVERTGGPLGCLYLYNFVFILVVSRDICCGTLLVTWNRKFSVICFDGAWNVCLSVSDEWFVFKVWQRKMISCCSAVLYIHSVDV